MKIIRPEYVFFDVRQRTKNTILKEISKKAIENKLATNQEELYEAFLKREAESSTGFENGFAIPHARCKSIKEPALFFVHLNGKGVDWNSIDGKPTKYLFVILVPESNENNIHMQILSNISIMMMDKNVMDKIITSEDKKFISNTINEAIEEKINNEKTTSVDLSSDKKTILALTACPVGVAHTYLAAEKLVEAGEKMGYNIKVETHGSQGVKNNFTQDEIDKADIIMVCADIGIPLDRFKNKRIFKSAIKPAIHNPESLIKEALEKAKIQKNDDSSKEETSSESNTKDSKVMKHILTGVSYMVPFVILGGICIALAVGLGKLIYGDDYSAVSGDFFFYLEKIGSAAFTLMIGALGAYIAYSIAGRAAIAPAFIVSVVANTPTALFPIGGINVATAMGFIGSILFGLAIGYTVKWINTWNINKTISAIMPIFVIPLGVGLFYGLLAIFVIGAPIGWVMDKFIWALQKAFTNGDIGIGVGIGIGILFGAMAGFDMGGPINKVAFLTCTALISSKVYQPMGLLAAAIPVAPLGMGLCTMIFKNKFNQNEKTLGISAFIMGMIGISEGAIPFAISDPKKAIICNVVGSAVAGAIAGGFGVTCTAAHGGPIVGLLLAVSSDHAGGLAWGIPFFFLAIVAGTLVTCFMYGFMRKVSNSSDKKDQKKSKALFVKKSKSPEAQPQVKLTYKQAREVVEVR